MFYLVVFVSITPPARPRSPGGDCPQDKAGSLYGEKVAGGGDAKWTLSKCCKKPAERPPVQPPPPARTHASLAQLRLGLVRFGVSININLTT